MKKVLLVALVMVAPVGVFAHDFDKSYFGEKSDYEDFISTSSVVNQGVVSGWWYPSYDEFLGK